LQFAQNWEDEYQILQPEDETVAVEMESTEGIIPLIESTPVVKARAKTPAKPKSKPAATKKVTAKPKAKALTPKVKAPAKPKTKKAVK
jgi:hypothetical protein